ncbi:MAG: MFS transporter [Anaerolineae bacterium]|nr:MFS transporter [Anaerolineae bacterium]
MQNHSLRRLVALASISFALTIATNTLEPAVYGHKILELVSPNLRNTALGLITFASALVAIIFPPFIGALSDRTNSRYGPRLPFIAVGTVFIILALFSIAWSPTLGVFIASVLIFQLSLSLIANPWQALYPDFIPQAQRGFASGVRGVLDILGLIIGRKVAGQLVGTIDQLGQNALFISVAVPAAAILVALVLVAAGFGGNHKPPNGGKSSSLRTGWRQAYYIDFKSHPAFAWWFANRFLFWMAFNILATFLLFYAIDVVGLPEAEAQVYLGNLALVLGSAIMVVTLPAGWLADRIGRKPLVAGSGFLAVVGAVILVFMRDLNVLTVAGAIIGLAAGVFTSANFALITDIVPPEESGRYMAVAGIASASGGAVARLLGALVVDPLNAYFSSQSAGYLILYGAAAAFFFLSALTALRIPVHKINHTRESG